MKNQSSLPLLLWLFLTLVIYPIPHTIALRNVLLGVGLIYCFGQIRHLSALRDFKPETICLGVLTVWLFFQAFFISPTPLETLDLLRGDWVIALLVMFLGVLVSLRCIDQSGTERAGQLIGSAIVAALYAMILFCLLEQLWLWHKSGSFPFGYARFGNRDNLSVLTNTGLSLVIGDFLARIIIKKSATALTPKTLGVLFALGLLATYTLSTRNGTVGVMLFLIVMMIMLLAHFSFNARTLIIGSALAALLMLIGWSSYRVDARWQGFTETAQIALDTENNRYWLNDGIFPRPVTPSGAPLEESAYMRIAWGKEALRQIAKHPFGVGYNHQALGAAIKMEYAGPIRVGASHNGLLEFTLGGGLPAIVLWLIFTGMLLRRGWKSFSQDKNPAGILLFFSVLCYFSRCALDGHLTGHRLEMFMFISGLLAAICAVRGTAKTDCPS